MSDIEEIKKTLTERTGGKKPFGRVVTFDLGEDGVLTLDARGESIVVSQDPTPGDVTIALSKGDFIRLLANDVSAQGLMMTGRVKLKGNTMVAMQLGEVLR